MRLFAHASYPFMRWRRRAYLVTAIVILAGISAMVYNAISIGSWQEYGVDFSGGTLVQVDFRRPTTVEEIRTINAIWEISRFGSADEFIIRMPSFDQEVGSGAVERVQQALSQRYDAGTYEIVRTEAVGPKVGVELQQKALIAILISFVTTLIYLAFRFEWRFGLASIAATAHDIVVTLGIMAILRVEISVAIVAALLTIIGYSLNDTIVVFDRIRENLQKPRRGSTYLELVNRSINETLSRTVITGSTSLLTLFALLVFGGPVIFDFALVLILGIVIGTFSSIFVASPVLYEIERRWPSDSKASGRGGGTRKRAEATV